MRLTVSHTLPTTVPLRARALGVVAAMVLVLGWLSASTPASAATDWLSRINSFRQQNGLGALAIDGELQSFAQQRSEANARSGRLEHTPSLSAGLTSNWVKLGENVGVGPSNNADMIWNAFLNSPPHRANLLDPAFTHVGIGEINTGTTLWVTHRFLRLGSSAPSAPGPVVVAAPPPPPTVVVPSPSPTPARVTARSSSAAASSSSGRGGATNGANGGATTSGTGAATGDVAVSEASAAGAGPVEVGVAEPAVAALESPAPDAAAVVDALRVLQQ